MEKPERFSTYQKLVILGLACLLFTVVLDYMLLSAVFVFLVSNQVKVNPESEAV